MPLHSLQHLSSTAVLGLWQLTEPPAELWAQLPQATTYQTLMPTTADAVRQAQWLAGRVLAHALLWKLVGAAQDGLVVQNDATGRPWLSGVEAQPLTLSLSHSGEWVAAVVAQGSRAGVDVEVIRDKAQRLASKFLSAAEYDDARAATQAAPDTAHMHYTRLWSAKETLYKLAAQRGIIFKKQLLLSSFVPEESGEIPGTLVLDGAETRHCICYYQPAPGYVLTFCHEPNP
ncbi:4'-phosphopantetheinyl transferase superfamily protein [Hymenobacter sp. BT683]|uniref:4'-phosphopantetheinyl transferase superfamily protein n=1 Tax=Hymenobacter jeongseonensis TaxID=2791027 RepID=A0ABS0IIV5_9BACT|nr:4'-phosphopantetheinyl transferase superfamily protein [Hymenobacter jeongseonensis]MBF9238304.1 4'-phosphopantetheinyl transferase superfamily protein [Hymenobacter jeongseonensis]